MCRIRVLLHAPSFVAQLDCSLPAVLPKLVVHVGLVLMIKDLGRHACTVPGYRNEPTSSRTAKHLAGAVPLLLRLATA